MFFMTPAFADEEFKAFVQKIRANDVQWVEKFLEDKAREFGGAYQKLNSEDPGFLCRPLFLARSPEMVNALRSAGAEMPKKKGIVREFFEAINADNVQLVREILDTGNVDVNTLGLMRRRAVMLAYSPEMVMLLVEGGAWLCNARRSREEYEQQSIFERYQDALPYTDDDQNNALHVLGETAQRLLQHYPGDDDIRCRIEATALFLIRQDLDAGQQNPGRTILAMRNRAGQQPNAFFRGAFWGAYFRERLGPVIEVRTRPVMPTLNINPVAEPQGVLPLRPMLVLAPAAVRPRSPMPSRTQADDMGIERSDSSNMFGDSL